MNYFLFLTISSLAVFFLPNYSHGQQEYPLPKNVNKKCDTLKDSKVFQPNDNGEWPDKVLARLYKVSKHNGKVRLDISWTADIKNVKGFRLVLTSGEKKWCLFLDYAHNIANVNPGKYRFGYTYYSIRKQKVYKAELSPLPLPSPYLGNLSVWDDFNSIVKNLTNYTPGTPADCSIFQTSITYDYDGRNMNVTFRKGTDACHYKAYAVSLFYNKTEVASNIVHTQANVDKLQVYFQLDKLNICRGNYFILVTVYDENPFDTNACVCKSNGYCQRCTTAKSNEMYFVPARSCTPNVTLPTRPEKEDILFPLTIVLGFLLLAALALSITHWKLSVHLMVKKRGIVLFLDDHEHHTNAVTKLINYLNESHLKVLPASTFVSNHDIPDQLVLIAEFMKSDFVLLVLSSALQKRMAAWEKRQDYVDFFKEKNSNNIDKTLLEMLLISNKLYVCKFDHVTEFGNWPKPCYSLPSNLSNMVADLNGQSYSQRLVLCNCLKSNALRDEFQTAFKKAYTYEQSHANWFQEKYVCPTDVGVYYETSQETLSQSVKPNALELKDVFIGYKNNNPDLPEESIITPSVFSEGISEKLEAVNNRNL